MAKDVPPCRSADFGNVATRTNALWQRLIALRLPQVLDRRNPHECAVAKTKRAKAAAALAGRNPHECAVAKCAALSTTRAQISRNPHECAVAKHRVQRLLVRRWVATRTNALWQRGTARCTRGKNPCRNPRECAVAKLAVLVYPYAGNGRNPHECAVAKVQDAKNTSHVVRRNPHECAVAKSRHCCARTENSENMNYVLLF